MGNNGYVWKGKPVTKQEMEKIAETRGEWQPRGLVFRQNKPAPKKDKKLFNLSTKKGHPFLW